MFVEYSQGYNTPPYTVDNFEPLYDSHCEPLGVLDGPWNEHDFVQHDCDLEATDWNGNCLPA